MPNSWLRRLVGAKRRPVRRKPVSLNLSLCVELLEKRATPALVAAYSFNEGTGTSAADASGSGNTGTLNGATWTTAGKYGQALSFNGSTSYVGAGNGTSLQITGSLTISAWIYSSAFPADDASIVSKRSSTELGFQLDTTIDRGPRTIGFKLTSASGALMARYGSTTLLANQWYFVTGVYNASAKTMDVYLNGVLNDGALVGTVTSTQQNSSLPVAIGKRSGMNGFAFNGRIDEVRIYNSVLTQTQIQTDMTTPLAPDTQAPTVPSNLTATAVSGSQINLSWTASTDNIAVTAYLVERQSPGSSSFVQIGTTSGSTFNDTGLTQNANYIYRVRATDAANNLSGYSNTASAITPDTQAPTAPSNLTATAVSGSQINLSWTASADNVGVTTYFVERQSPGNPNFVQIGTTVGTTYNNVGLTQGTTYSYRIRATDAANNLSGYSNTANAQTQDTQVPTAPSNLTATAVSGSQINLSWTASTDNIGVAIYFVERQSPGSPNFVQIGTTSGATFNDTGLTPNTSYSYRVRAADAASNLSSYSNIASATTPFLDTAPPTIPSYLTATAVNGSQINLSWTASTDNVGVSSYLVERQSPGNPNFVQIGTTVGTTYNDTGLTQNTNYIYRVRATDAANNLSGYSNTASATTPDTQSPTVPGNLTAAAVSGSQINLSWTASTDNVGVTSYLVERQSPGNPNFVQVATASGTTYDDTGLTQGTSYSYRIRAADAANNLSGYSNTATAQTQDTQAPTAPSNLTAMAFSGSQINLSWTASTDNVGVIGYRIERQDPNGSNFVQIATTSGTTLSDVGLSASSNYAYRVRATDAAGNPSDYSNVASSTTFAPSTASSFESNSGMAAEFGTYEVVLTGNGSVANPFNTTGTVTFTSPSNQTVTVNDFFDGGNTWRARVYVTEIGRWYWSASSSTDQGLNGRTGTFTASDTGLPGLLKFNPNNPKAWVDQSGQQFVYRGEATWLLFNQNPTFSPNYQRFVDDAATQGINTLGPAGLLGAWGGVNPTVPGLGNNDPWFSGDNTRYDLSKFQTTDGRVEWIFNNHSTMYIQGQFIGTEWQYNNAWENLPQSVRNNTLNYMIARSGAFPNMIWLVSEDQYTDQTSTQIFNRDVGPYIAAHTPWKHLLSTQSINETFTFTTASDLNWVDYIPLQVGNDPSAQGANQIQTYASVPRHVQMAEDWYEQDDFWHAELYFTADTNFFFRWDFWSWTLAGGSANHGARTFSADPYSQTGTNTYVEPISPFTNFSGMALHGLDSLPYLWPYFQNRNIDLSVFQQNNSLVTAWSMASGLNWHPNLVQRGTNEFLVYDPNAIQQGTSSHLDAARTASMTVNLSSAPGNYQVEWYRPIDGAVQSAGTVAGGTSRTFTAPWQGCDVVLRLLLVVDTQPPTAPTNLTANGAVGTVALSWTPATDNIGVARYHLYRSTSPGFTPTAANQIAQPNGSSYTDTGLAASPYYYRLSAEDASGNVSPFSNEASATVLADTTAPTVSIISPTSGATILGSVSIVASASDDVGIAGVTFFIDGNILGSEDTIAPYSAIWDSNTVSNGTHVLTARARDTGGNATASAAIMITVSNAPASGLVVGMGFNEGTGTTTADSSGNGNTGTLNGATWTALGKFGKALSFNGTTAYVGLGNASSLQITGSMSLSAWIFSSAFPADDAAIVSKRGSTNNGFQLDTTIDRGPRTIGFKLTSTSGAIMARYGSTALVTNQWYYVTGVYNAATLTMDVYLNGVLDNGALVGAITSSQQNSTLPVVVGKRSGLSGFAFNGRIDEVRLYNRALSAAEVQSNMNTPIGSPERLLGMAVTSGNAPSLSNLEIRPLFDEAVTRWTQVLGDASAVRRLWETQFAVLDLPGTLLGLASSSIIFIDANAAGHGWFIDKTPWDDSEFVAGQAKSAAANRVDLLTVLTHEMGHILGLDDDASADPYVGDVMADTIPVGVRRIHVQDSLKATHSSWALSFPSAPEESRALLMPGFTANSLLNSLDAIEKSTLRTRNPKWWVSADWLVLTSPWPMTIDFGIFSTAAAEDEHLQVDWNLGVCVSDSSNCSSFGLEVSDF